MDEKKKIVIRFVFVESSIKLNIPIQKELKKKLLIFSYAFLVSSRFK